MSVIDITPAGIAAHQAERKAFLATEIGGLLHAFKHAYGNAWRMDDSESISDRRLQEYWDKANAAEEALVAAIKRLQAEGRAEALPDSEAGGTPNSPAVLASKGA